MAECRADVLIVGAGPTGLLLGCLLARSGVSFEIIDRAAKPSSQSRGTGLHWSTLDILEDLGLSDRAQELGFWLEGTSLYQNGQLLKRFPLKARPTDRPALPSESLLVLEQDKLEALLTRHLSDLGVEIRRKCELRDFENHSDCVRAILREADKEEAPCFRYLVGCDGGQSKVREHLKIPFVGQNFPRPYLLAELHVDWELPMEMYRFVGETAELDAIPLGGDLYRITAWGTPSTEGEEFASEEPSQGAPSLQQLQEIANLVVPVPTTFSEPRALRRYRIESRLALSYSKDRVFLCGDACHVHPPTGSVGLNTGVQDAYNLGWKLASVLKGECPESILGSYEVERRPVGEWVISHTHSAAMSQLEVDGAKPVLEEEKLAIHGWNQSTLNYRQSPAVKQFRVSGRKKTPHAGDRLRDGLVSDAGNQEETRLFDLLNGGRHHLLLFSQDEQAAFAQVGSLVAGAYPNSIAVHRFGAGQPTSAETDTFYEFSKPTAVLVRPDRYIAAVADPAQEDMLLDFLREYFWSGVSVAPKD